MGRVGVTERKPNITQGSWSSCRGWLRSKQAKMEEQGLLNSAVTLEPTSLLPLLCNIYALKSFLDHKVEIITEPLLYGYDED